MQMRINYYQVIRQANSISNQADRISRNINKLDDMIQQVKTSWKSPSAQTFLTKCMSLREEMRESQRETEQLARSIKNVANRIKREDEAAAERARLLKEQSKN